MIDPGNSQEKRVMDEAAQPLEQEQTIDERGTVSAGDQEAPDPVEAPTGRRRRS